MDDHEENDLELQPHAAPPPQDRPTVITPEQERRAMQDMACAKREHQNGSVLPTLFVIVLLLGLGGGAYWWQTHAKESAQVAASPVQPVQAAPEPATEKPIAPPAELEAVKPDAATITPPPAATQEPPLLPDSELLPKRKTTDEKRPAENLEDLQRKYTLAKNQAKALNDALNSNLKEIDDNWAEMDNRDANFRRFAGNANALQGWRQAGGLSYQADGEAQKFDLATNRMWARVDKAFEYLTKLGVVCDKNLDWDACFKWPRMDTIKLHDILSRIPNSGVTKQADDLKKKIAEVKAGK